MYDWHCLNYKTAKAHYSLLFFHEVSSRCRFAVADWSIDDDLNPESTEDGLLLIDKDRPATIGLRSVVIPVLTRAGEQRYALASIKDLPAITRALRLAAVNMELDCEAEFLVRNLPVELLLTGK